MKKVIALGLVAAFSTTLQADQQNWNTANTFLRFETPYQSASPERLALFNSEDLRQKHRASHNGDVEFVIFGGQNSSQADAAAYYMPGGLESLAFNASIDDLNSGSDTALTYWSGSQGGVSRYATIGTGQVGNNPSGNYAMGVATGVGSAGTPWTLGTATADNTFTASGDLAVAVSTIAARDILNVTGDPAAPTAVNQFVIGTGTASTYTTQDLNQVRAILSDASTGGNLVNVGSMVVDSNKNVGILRPWNFGVGYAPNVQFGYALSESAFVSTIAPELKRSHWGIGATWKQLLSEKDTGFFLELSTALQRVTMNMNLNEIVGVDLTLNPDTNVDSVSAALWADSWSAQGYSTGNETAPTTITEAFAQDAWLYGKLDGAQSVTRLADIELKLGYQFICEDNVMSNMFVGIVVPTGNRAQSLYLAEPIVGNGFHFGLMFGSTQEIQLDMGSETRWSMRSDANFRYLFQNTQVRSFDTVSNGQWSRYMMVWPDYATEQADGELLTTASSLRAYTPGINVFTQEMYVTPRAQARINEAIVLEHGSFKAEFGWNMMIRQAEEVSLVNAWTDDAIAFVDASNQSTSLFNATRTIYNDSYQSTPVTNGGDNGTGVAGESESQYNAASISSSDLNLDSAASPAAFTNTPYLALGYAFNEEKSSVFSVGVSYEMSATNGYINDWMLWGKFGFTF
ncbi:MAG: hypothetical protein Q8Q60_03970 [Candidatus Chromulinivorax sp.]|nr:hypothetical protein [Candidatus Chromulinivorax sp.]